MAKQQWDPVTLLKTSGSYWEACALHAAVKLSIFTLLSEKPATADIIAGNVGAAPRAMAMLLDALCAMALIEKIKGRYHLTLQAGRYLVESSADYIGSMILHHHHLTPSWACLDEAVTTGKPLRKRDAGAQHKRREAFLMGMYNLAGLQASGIVRQVDLSHCKRLLDIGGATGAYAIAFCRQYPELEAVVFDLPTTKPYADKILGQSGLTGRILFQGGDYLRDPLPDDFDVVWLSQILHAEGMDMCRRIIAKAFNALRSGGLMLIHEFILQDSMDGPLFPALFALNMLLGTEQGQAYSQGQLFQMLGEAGVENICRHSYEGPMASGIISGRKPMAAAR